VRIPFLEANTSKVTIYAFLLIRMSLQVAKRKLEPVPAFLKKLVSLIFPDYFFKCTNNF